MELIQIKSILKAISDEIDCLISNEVINSETKVAVWGMDTYSFAIKSLLKNRNILVKYYVSNNNLEVVEMRRRISGFINRYANSNDSFVTPILITDIDNDELSKTLLLNSSKISCAEKDSIYLQGFVENTNFYNLYNWEKDEFSELVKSKRELSLEEIHILEKEILKDFDSFCCENGLRYWVCGGTLLGTIRHKGFIPWDDDIDVFMPWEDYCSFIKLYKDTIKYQLVCLDKSEYSDRYADVWAKIVDKTTITRENASVYYKIHPIWIDIFPIVGLPDSIEERHRVFREEIELERCGIERFYRSNGEISARNSFYKELVQLYGEIDFDNAEQVGILGTQYGEKDSTSRKVYNGTIRMPFEDIEVNVPVGYKEYLDNLYGANWMEIPEESDRKTHNLEAYWL